MSPDNNQAWEHNVYAKKFVIREGHFAGVVNGIACYQALSGWSLTASVRIAQVTTF